MTGTLSRRITVLTLGLATACGSDGSSGKDGAAGQAGTGATAGVAGTGAAAGMGAAGGAGASSGTGGAGATAGTAGAAGSAGTAGVPNSISWQRHGASLLRPGVAVGNEVEIVLADVDAHVRSDGTWYLYFNGATAETFVSDDITGRVVVATSSDGLSWTRVGTAIGDPGVPGAWDEIRTETPTVVEVPDNPAARRYVMAYSGAAGPSALGFPDYQVGIAFSADGVTFERLPAGESPHAEAGYAYNVFDAMGSTPGVTDGVVADPELVYADGVLHLFHSAAGWNADGDVLAFGIGHATSDDGGVSWTPVEAPVASLTDTNGIGGQQPSVSFNPDTQLWEMVFTSDQDSEREAMPSTFNPSMGVWLATSPDLMTWTVDWERRTFEWDADAPHETFGLLTGAELVTHAGQRHLFYTGWGDEGVPDGFLVPTHTGYEPAVINLLVAHSAL